LAPLPFTPGICLLSNGFDRSLLLVDCCYLVVSVTFHVVHVDRDYHGLWSVHSSGPSGFRSATPRFIHVAYCLLDLDSHGLFSFDSYCSSGPSGSSPTPQFIQFTLYYSLDDSCASASIHVVPVVRCNYHGLLLIYSSSRKHSMFRTLVVVRSVVVPQLLTWLLVDSDSHGLFVIFADLLSTLALAALLQAQSLGPSS
jgi:hypothetical protein